MVRINARIHFFIFCTDSGLTRNAKHWSFMMFRILGKSLHQVPYISRKYLAIIGDRLRISIYYNSLTDYDSLVLFWWTLRVWKRKWYTWKANMLLWFVNIWWIIILANILYNNIPKCKGSRPYQNIVSNTRKE